MLNECIEEIVGVLGVKLPDSDQESYICQISEEVNWLLFRIHWILSHILIELRLFLSAKRYRARSAKWMYSIL